MRNLRWLFLLAMVGVGAEPGPAPAAPTARIVKVLSYFTDREGKIALNPSLYERDAYQAYLRKHPEERTGLRFDVQWKSHGIRKLTLHLELRGNQGRRGTTQLLEEAVQHHGWFDSWSTVVFRGDAYSKFGELSAWRATLWDGNTQLAEQKSFLW